MVVEWSRKGQVTLFIILGIVLLAVFAFALKARAIINKEQLQQEAESTVTEFLQANSITYYVESCLERVLDENLKKFGEHGGVANITGTLGEDYLTFELPDGNFSNVTYGLVPNDDCVALAPFQGTQFYPYPMAHLADLTHISYKSRCFNLRGERSGYYGYQFMPGMCEPLGQNSYQWVGNNYIWLWCRAGDTDYSGRSIQEHLQNNISRDLLTCVNFSVYETKGHNITLEEENVTSALIYGFDSTTAVVQFPFKVNIQNNEPIIVRRTFRYKTPIRFRMVYEFIAELLQLEANNLLFNDSMQYSTIDSYDPSFEVEFKENACSACLNEGKFDDVIIVKDKGSLIDNEPFVFQTAIKDRQPALDYIHADDAGNRYDIKLLQNESLTIRPEGFDPDDTKVNFYYEGWRQDYDEVFDFEKCKTTDRDKFPDCENCVTKVPVRDESKNWMSSSMFLSSGKNSEIETNMSDTGPHNVRVKVVSEGREDYQDVKILIFDLPVAVPKGENPFDGLNNSIASIEDPYTLDGSDSRASMIQNEDLSTYYWSATDPSGDLEPIGSTTKGTARLPDDFWSDADLRNYPNYPFRKVGLYDLTLTVSSDTLMSEPVDMEVNVYECIPFRSDIPSYPYGGDPDEVASYNHTCCGGEIDDDGNIQVGASGKKGEKFGDAKTCYESTKYGYLPDFDHVDSSEGISPPSWQLRVNVDAFYQTYNNPFDFQGIFESVTNGHRERENDVFEKKMERKCADRGNLCDGNIVEEVTISQLCDDWQGNEDERCTGPPYSISNHNRCYGYYFYPSSADNICSVGTPGCDSSLFPDDDTLGRKKPRPYSTFELMNNLLDKNENLADGVCNPTWANAVGWGMSYDETSTIGIYSCQGGCGSGGCTKAIRCVCDTSNGARLDHKSPKSNYDDYSDPNNPICEWAPQVYPCPDDTQPSCDYGHKDPCPRSCINNPRGESCEVHNLDKDDTCYYMPESVGKPCFEYGCRLPNHATMLEDHCGVCEPSGYTQGDYCPPPGTTDGGFCYHGGRTCSGTTCNLDRTPLSGACGSDAIASCTSSGVVCKLKNGEQCNGDHDACDSGYCDDNDTPSEVSDDFCSEPSA